MNKLSTKEYFLKAGYIYFAVEPTIISSVLGSCVAVTIFDRENKFGGMNHFVHSAIINDAQPTALYAKPAVLQLLRLFRYSGANMHKLEAQIFGGAASQNSTGELAEIGSKNQEMAESLLKSYDIDLVGRDIGGFHGRKIVFNTETGEVVIAKVEKIRNSDWYPGQEFM